jgi:hypothetical protein
MLPGFRFVFAAIVLSMSILVFGFGAAALLRTAHEEFASTPALYAPPETRFAQASDTTKPMLALMRVDEAPKAEPPRMENTPAAAATEPATPTAPSEQTAALQPADSPSPGTAKTEPAAGENSPQAASPAAPADTSATAEEIKVAATEPTVPTASEPAPTVSAASAMPAEAAAPAEATAPVQASAPTAADIARSLPSDPKISTRIATLGGPPVDIAKEPAAKAASAKPDASAVKKREQAKREHKRRQIAARARVARQVQPVDPFAPQPTITPR